MAEELEPVPEEAQEPRIRSTSEDRTMAMLGHLGGIVGGFLVPLIVWLVKKDQSRFVADQGKEALNFQLTLLIGHVIGGVTICFTFGMLNLACWVLGIVFSILAAVAANKGEVYRYPVNIRFIS
jgi:uncharacterized Tic20 family protein